MGAGAGAGAPAAGAASCDEDEVACAGAFCSLAVAATSGSGGAVAAASVTADVSLHGGVGSRGRGVSGFYNMGDASLAAYRARATGLLEPGPILLGTGSSTPHKAY